MHTNYIHELVSCYFSIPRVREISAIDSGLGNYHYKLSCEHNESYFIKIYRDYNVPLIDKELSLAVALKAYGILTPDVIVNKSGELCTTHQGQTAVLFEFIEGTHLEPTLENLYAIGGIIGKIHRCKPDVHLNGYTTSPGQLFHALQQVVPAERATAGFFQTAASISMTIPFEKLSKSLIHGDIFLDNLLETASHEIYVIDFEETAFENRLFDLSRAVIGSCRIHDRIDITLCRMLLKGYTEFHRLSALEEEYFYEYIIYAGLHHHVGQAGKRMSKQQEPQEKRKNTMMRFSYTRKH